MQELIKSVLNNILKCIGYSIDENKLEPFVQFVMFAMVGVTNSIIYILVNVSVIYALRNTGVKYDFIFANLVSFFISVLWAFYWNNRLVFKLKEGEQRNVWKTILKTYSTYAFTGLVLNNVLSWIWINCFGLSKYIIPVINIAIGLPFDFFVNKFWAFKSSLEDL